MVPSCSLCYVDPRGCPHISHFDVANQLVFVARHLTRAVVFQGQDSCGEFIRIKTIQYIHAIRNHSETKNKHVIF